MTYCFMVLRYVENEYFNNYWIECCKSIRKYYTNDIIIVDNNSKETYLNQEHNFENLKIIKSKFPQTRLFSPFYEFLKMDKLYDKAVIIHDGIIFNQFVDFSKVNNVKFLWHFEKHTWDNPQLEIKMLKQLHNSDKLINLYNSKSSWVGCLGCMLCLDKNFIQLLEDKYNISVITNFINDQTDAIAFERVIAAICFAEYPSLSNDISFEGDIKNMVWGYTYAHYIDNENENKEVQKTKKFYKLFGARV